MVNELRHPIYPLTTFMNYVNHLKSCQILVSQTGVRITRLIMLLDLIHERTGPSPSTLVGKGFGYSIVFHLLIGY